ncbi:GntR family transcriptional regulator [Streptomyces sparsogenes]|uniref:GntR family transcriptional regulator n=1 Tax=Streptomyces sparsogenes TaxID=67365 RepID=UPI0033C470EB
MDRTLAGRQLAAVISGPPGIRLGYRKPARSVRSLGLDGRIALHTRLPAERELASALGVSRATVTAAYDLLRESGYARSRRGAGTWTALPDGRSPTSVASMVSGEQAVIDLALAALAPPRTRSLKRSPKPPRCCPATRLPLDTTPMICPTRAPRSPIASPAEACPRCPTRS